LANEAEVNHMRPLLDRVVPMDDAEQVRDAIQRVADHRGRGRVVLSVPAEGVSEEKDVEHEEA
jgi:hypothetical protein